MDHGSGIAVSCGVGPRCSSDLDLLWLWHRLAAIAPAQPPAWELLYEALKSKEKKKKSENTKTHIESPVTSDTIFFPLNDPLFSKFL